MKVMRKYMRIIDTDDRIIDIDGYVVHYVDNGWLTIKYTTERGSEGTFSKVMSDIKSYDLHMDVLKEAPIENINVDIIIKKDDDMKEEKFDELAEWFKGRFDGIKTITRVERADKVIKDSDGEPTGVVRKGGIFTTVLLESGSAGVVTVQEGSEDNAELGILWAYTKAKENEKKDSINKTFKRMLNAINPCSEISMYSGMDMGSGVRGENITLAMAKRRESMLPSVYFDYIGMINK